MSVLQLILLVYSAVAVDHIGLVGHGDKVRSVEGQGLTQDLYG